MLYYSDNHYAEQFLRTLGGETGGVADDASGLAAERHFLSEHGIPDPGLQLHRRQRPLRREPDCSGDARAYSLRRAAARRRRVGLPAAPAGGEQGTLRDYDFTTALGRVRAKSGHISGVSSLAGYVNTLHHGRVVFTFMVNGSLGDPDAAIVRAVDRLAEF